RREIGRVPILRDLDKSLATVAALIRVGSKQEAPVAAVAPLPAAAGWRERARSAPGVLNESESKRLIADYGITLPREELVGFAVPRLDRARALTDIRRLAAARRLEGYRGSTGDIIALADAIVAVGRLACDLGDALESLDINPILVREQGIVALDALAVLRS